MALQKVVDLVEYQQEVRSDRSTSARRASNGGTDNSGRHERLALATLLAVALAIRVLGIGRPLWTDEIASIRAAEASDFLAKMLSSMQPSLYYLLLRVWLWLGDSDEWLRALSIPFGTLGIFFTYRWLARYSRRAAWLGALLVAFLPLMLRYSLEVRPYCLLVALAPLTLLLAEQLAHRWTRRSAAALAAALVSMILVHPIGVFFLPAVAAFVLMHPERRWPLGVRHAGWLVAPCLLFVVLFTFVFSRFIAQPGWWIPYPSFARIRIVAESFLGLSAMPTSLEWWTALILEASIAIATIASANARLLPLGAAFVAYVIPLFVYSSFGLPLLLDRTLIPAFFPFAGLVAVAASDARRWALRVPQTAAICLLCCLFARSWLVSGMNEPKERWTPLFEALHEAGARDVVVFGRKTLWVYHPEERYGGPLRNVIRLDGDEQTEQHLRDLTQRISAEHRDLREWHLYVIWRPLAAPSRYSLSEQLSKLLGPPKVLHRSPWLYRFTVRNRLDSGVQAEHR